MLNVLFSNQKTNFSRVLKTINGQPFNLIRFSLTASDGAGVRRVLGDSTAGSLVGIAGPHLIIHVIIIKKGNFWNDMTR